MSKKKYTYIDLFSGSGGFSLGFDQAGFENIFSVEYDHENCDTYRYNFPNHHLIECDITKLENENILEIVGGRPVDVVIGGPPCQGFSMAGNIGRKFADDPRNLLFKEFRRYLIISLPSFPSEISIKYRLFGSKIFLFIASKIEKFLSKYALK